MTIFVTIPEQLQSFVDAPYNPLSIMDEYFISLPVKGLVRRGLSWL